MLRSCVLALVLAAALAGSCAALTFISPTEGATVREEVRIAVARSDVPEGGFVVFNIDGEFRAAVGSPKEIGRGRSAFTFDWDTKAPIPERTVGFGLGAEPRYVADGKHDIEVVVHGSAGDVKERATVSVRVANKIPTTIPAKPVKLVYRLSTGQHLMYDIKGKLEILDTEGRPMLDDPVILTSSSQVAITVEDQTIESSLVRYRWQPVVSIQYFGMPYPEPVYVPAPSYRYVTPGGKVTEAGFGQKSKVPLFDLFVQVPAGFARPGDSWSGSDTLTVPGILRGAVVNVKSAFDSQEWESGHECAKLKMALSSRFGLALIKDRLEMPESDVTGTGTAYFAYKTGKLISVDYVFTSQATVENSVLDSLRQGQGGDVGNVVLPSTGPEIPYEDSGPAPYSAYPTMPTTPGRRPYGTSSGAPSSGGYTGPSYGGEAAAVQTTPVKFRITVSVKQKK